jgi:hypothetical protein
MPRVSIHEAGFSSACTSSPILGGVTAEVAMPDGERYEVIGDEHRFERKIKDRMAA